MSEKEKEGVASGCVFLLIGLPVALFTDAWVLWKGWHWFAVPLGAPSLSLATIVGLRQMWSVFFSRARSKDDRGMWEMFGIAIAVDAIALLVMWIAHTAGAA